MPRGVLKENLPEQLCVTCNRPFTWRKKWERCWDEVTTCSKSCNAKRRETKALQRQREGDAPDDVTAVVGALTDMNLSTQGNDDGKDRISLDELADEEGEGEDDDNGGKEDTNSGEKPTNEYPVGSREWRKVQRKAAKAQQRLTRKEGAGEDAGRKSCDLCAKRVDLLIRCTTDSTKQWRMVCGRCWRDVSGGVPDGDAAHPHYTYGGLWKNRSRGAS